ncbi:MAG: tyrosine-type recombinase/integrase [Deltaproteobacteria bacterium]|nr:tyrosine-type recombinase/integrase [Deltaproteobacteria bacterium]
MAVKRRRLTDANVARLTPAVREYTVWDTRHAGLGVRVRPSGHRSFVYRRKGESDARRITLGSAVLMGVEEARARCLEIETGARSDRPEGGSVPTFGDFVAGPGQVCIDRCKPSTQKAERWMLSARLLPAFGSLPVNRIAPANVHRWFDEYSRTAPGGANRALGLLRRILNQAVACGHLDTNPARGVKRNPRPKPTRFLSREEIQLLHRALDRHAAARPSRARQADIIRLLLLTGCRKSEIVTMRWQDLDGGTLNLADAKTGPRKVLLNAPARAILERQPRSGSVYVFPSPLDPRRPMSSGLPLWYRVRKEARIEDVRLHDLRHTFASHAVLQGIPLPVVSRLLGHKQPSMTMRYAHVADGETEAAAERIGMAIARALGGRVASSPD